MAMQARKIDPLAANLFLIFLQTMIIKYKKDMYKSSFIKKRKDLRFQVTNILAEVYSCFPRFLKGNFVQLIDHFTVVCLVTWPLSGSEAGGDFVLIQTLLLFMCKCKLVSMRTT